MQKSVKKFEDFRTQAQKKVVKQRAHKRLRRQLQKEMRRG